MYLFRGCATLIEMNSPERINSPERVFLMNSPERINSPERVFLMNSLERINSPERVFLINSPEQVFLINSPERGKLLFQGLMESPKNECYHRDTTLRGSRLGVPG
jgi:hypothetical protein